jgi:hypothetical protein
LKKVSLRNSIFIVLTILTASCGLKGNPVPYSNITHNKPQVERIAAVPTADAVVLNWNFRDGSGLFQYIYIERSEIGSPGNECRDCPLTFERAGQIAGKEMTPAERKTTYTFVDKQVIRGKIYTYRLKICGNNGNCSESAPVEINYR